MKIKYDSKMDAVYIELAKGKYKVSREITGAVIVDEDAKGKILGIEILDATKNNGTDGDGPQKACCNSTS